MKALDPRDPLNRRQPVAPPDPLDDPREAPTPEKPPQGWNSNQPVRRHC